MSEVETSGDLKTMLREAFVGAFAAIGFFFVCAVLGFVLGVAGS